MCAVASQSCGSRISRTPASPTACWLLDTLRRALVQAGIARRQLDTLRLRLLKIGGWVRQHAQTLHLHLASSHPGELLWHLLAARFTLPE
jgi:hypothetical protein